MSVSPGADSQGQADFQTQTGGLSGIAQAHAYVMPYGQGIVRRSLGGVARKMGGFPRGADGIARRKVPLHTQGCAQRISEPEEEHAVAVDVVRPPRTEHSEHE